MDDYEKDFYRRESKVNEFKKDLKKVFEKHKVRLKDEVEMWHGGRKDILEVRVDGERWMNDFDELLREIEVVDL